MEQAPVTSTALRSVSDVLMAAALVKKLPEKVKDYELFNNIISVIYDGRDGSEEVQLNSICPVFDLEDLTLISCLKIFSAVNPYL